MQPLLPVYGLGARARRSTMACVARPIAAHPPDVELRGKRLA
jgi:hypothetical protein